MDLELLTEREKKKAARLKKVAKRRERRAAKRRAAVGGAPRPPKKGHAAAAVDKAKKDAEAPPEEKSRKKKDPAKEFEKQRTKERIKRAKEKAAWDEEEQEVEADRLKQLVQKKAPEIDVPKDWRCPGGYEKNTKKSAMSPRKVCSKVGAIKKFLHKIGVRKIKDERDRPVASLLEDLQVALEG